MSKRIVLTIRAGGPSSVPVSYSYEEAVSLIRRMAESGLPRLSMLGDMLCAVVVRDGARAFINI